jgi:hypothetical protein
MSQDLANFGQRGALTQHLGGERMAKLMRAMAGCLDAGPCEVMLNE